MIWDLIFIFSGKGNVSVIRNYPEKFSNGDENPLVIRAESRYPRRIIVRILEEFPVELQVRDKDFEITLFPFSEKEIHYSLKLMRWEGYWFRRIW